MRNRRRYRKANEVRHHTSADGQTESSLTAWKDRQLYTDMNTPSKTTTTTAVSLRSELEGDRFKRAIAQLLPKILPPDRFIRIALLAMTRTPKLQECERKSFFNSLLTLSALGIEPDGRRAHLIPFENRKRGVVECQLIVDYKGLAELVLRSGEVTALHADVVRENDTFEHDRGRVVKHTYKLGAPRGEVIGAYAYATTKGGAEMAKVLTLDEIESVRSRSKAGQSGPWVTDFAEMAKKTAFRQLSKWLPLSPEVRTAIDNEGDVPAEAPTKDGETVFDLGPDDVSVATEPAPTPEPAKKTESLADVITGAGFSFDDFRTWAQETDALQNADSLGSFDDISPADQSRLYRVRAAIIKGMTAIRENGGGK